MEGSFRDLHVNTSKSSNGNSAAHSRNLANRSPTSAAGDANPTMNNYSTFSNDQVRVCDTCSVSITTYMHVAVLAMAVPECATVV